MDKIKVQRQTLKENSVIEPLLDFIREGVMITNRSRQIVYANAALVQMTGSTAENDILGLAPGKALQCVHALEEVQKCGFTRYCSTCGSMFSLVAETDKDDRFHDFSLSTIIIAPIIFIKSLNS